jgi:hypothetical protein
VWAVAGRQANLRTREKRRERASSAPQAQTRQWGIMPNHDARGAAQMDGGERCFTQAHPSGSGVQTQHALGSGGADPRVLFKG